MEDNQKKGKKISTTVLKDEDFYNRQKSDHIQELYEVV